MTHYLVLVPLRLEGDWFVEVDCWADRTWTVVAMGCACGYRHRLIDQCELGVAVGRFYGEMSLSDEALSRFTAELDSSRHALLMVPAWFDIQEVPQDVSGRRVTASV